MTLTADAFTGSLLAVEGIRDATVVLNGPTGCKYYHSHISDKQYPKASSLDPLGYTEEFYFGQPRIPCTYLEGQDYIGGGTEKLQRILPAIASKNNDLLVIVNSPGASLIGDDLKRFIDSASLSKRCIAIEVETVLCAGTSIEELRRSSSVAFNLVIFPEYGLKIAKWYEERFDIPYIISQEGGPVGYDATEMWIEKIACSMSVDPSKAIEMVKKERKKHYHKISRFYSLTGLPKGATFLIKGDSSVVLPLTKWLYEYLGMEPLGVKTLPGMCSGTERQIIDLLENIGFADSWNNFSDDIPVDVVLADGHTVKMMSEKKLCRSGIEISMPSSGYLNFLPRTYIGINGALFLLEQIFNGLRRMP
ncbi:nitrogenase component 1 [Methanolobus profundi]|uniref:Nitrogenase molybdenum-iron protein, alpha and beta chains n=1 Tax=Methanolobus profundi TaxID=487685 RepID=A0A1I4PGP2_9EURY|nr:nitrogenase component 1 [Methanolobus profundi]SFM26982.1 Nitrogenase molybdenum-iron protein, alpha and beta chains [Methanolobus profundi]